MGGTLRLRRRKDVFARHRSNYYYLKKPLVNQFKTPELKLISENKQLYANSSGRKNSTKLRSAMHKLDPNRTFRFSPG